MFLNTGEGSSIQVTDAIDQRSPRCPYSSRNVFSDSRKSAALGSEMRADSISEVGRSRNARWIPGDSITCRLRSH